MMTNIELNEKIRSLLTANRLTKLIFSRYRDKSVRRTEGHLFSKNGSVLLQLESFHADGKATHRNFPLSEAADAVISEFSACRQMNLFTSAGELEAKLSSAGALFVTDSVREVQESAPPAAPEHDHVKQYILRENVPHDFLILLGISDKNGRVYDKKQSKFRQINRFLENVAAILRFLPEEGALTVLDLCCGKSYLTFAVYYYLTVMRGRTVRMIGADRKPDVIRFCADTAASLHYNGLSFVCCDIGELAVPQKPDLVLSLHACDIATDIVLAKAIVTHAKVILSTPCCHHELMQQITKNTPSPLQESLSPITEQSMLRQKLCDALTDGLRCRMLEAEGYDVTVTELIDPEETPKNLLIRAVRATISAEKRKKLLENYDAVCRFAGVRPFLPGVIAAYRSKLPSADKQTERI